MPTVVYNVDGLRDSVRTGETGFVTLKNTPESLAVEVARVAKLSTLDYAAFQKRSLEWAKKINFE